MGSRALAVRVLEFEALRMKASTKIARPHVLDALAQKEIGSAQNACGLC